MAVFVSRASLILRIFSRQCFYAFAKDYSVRYCSSFEKKFYKKVGISFSNGHYDILLDEKKLKTPRGNPFTVPNEPLARAVAAEWDAQKETIERHSMHLSALSCTVIDNPYNLTKFQIVQSISMYLSTDTVLFYSEQDDGLYALQKKEWDPVIKWFCQRFMVSVEPTRSIQEPAISTETKAVITNYLLSYNIWSIHGFLYGVDVVKSVILTMGCAENYLRVEKAVLLSRLEEEFQVGRWGRIGDIHDFNQKQTQARLAAALLFIRFNAASEV